MTERKYWLAVAESVTIRRVQEMPFVPHLIRNERKYSNLQIVIAGFFVQDDIQTFDFFVRGNPQTQTAIQAF